MKLSMLSICGVLISLLMSGCSAIDALQFLYNNKMASHTWQTQAKQTSIPFEVLNQQVIAEVTVNGTKNLRMVLDTGAQATVFFFETDKTKSFINSLDGKLSIGGVGDKSGDAYFLKDTDLSIGSVTISGLTTIFIKEEDNPMFASQEVTYVDGVIGSDLFTRFVTDINFTKRTITLAETMVKLPSEYQRIPLEIKGSLPYLDIEIKNEHGSAKLPVLFDSGGIGSLHISSNTSVPKGEMLYQSFSSGVGGKSNITVNHLGTVIVGDFQIPGIIGGVSENGTSKTNIMGTGLINRFNMILDYASEQVFLSANENFATPDYANNFGALLMPHRSGGFVQDIRVDSPASKFGLREADVIVSVNGHTMTYRSFDHYSAKLAIFNEVNEICYLRDSTTSCTSIAI